MKNILIYLLLVALVVSCSSTKKDKDSKGVQNSIVKQSTLSKEYPGLFSAQDSYIHLPIEEKEGNQIIFSCSNAQVTETLKKLFNDMKDPAKVYINSYYVATCYALNKDLSRALHYYGKVYSSAPDINLKSKALANMGVVQWLWGKNRKALAYLREAFNIQNNPTTLYLLTSLELELGLYQKVASRRVELGTYSYTDPAWRFLLAESAFFVSDYDKAVVVYESLPDELWEKQSSSITNYIVALYKTGRHEVAKSFVAKWKLKLITSSSYQTAKNLLPEISKYE